MKKTIVSNSKPVGKVLPITPDMASQERLNSIEPEMIQAVNNMIVKKLDSTRTQATIKQDDIVAEYFKIKGVLETPALRSDLYQRHQLDFEDIFRDFGWRVVYDKPAYNESYDANFKFEKKK